MGALIRWAVGVEYFGNAYSGWQVQHHQSSVQSALQAALSSVADHPVEVVAAGRTDAGVHALCQVIHFDSAATRSPQAWVLGSNTELPPDISLRWAQTVAPEFSARFSALKRRYRYVLHNQRARSALLAGRVGWWIRELDADAMNQAAQILVGEHDFSAYRDSQCQSPTAVRRIFSLSVLRKGEFVVVDICGNAFLHHMVRNITGVLVAIGQGRRPIEWARQVLDSGDRRQAGVTMPAAGLYFLGPEYPAEFGLPAAPTPWFP